MNRRTFLLNALKGAAATALVPPSQVWPFRKIFLPIIFDRRLPDEIFRPSLLVHGGDYVWLMHPAQAAAFEEIIHAISRPLLSSDAGKDVTTWSAVKRSDFVRRWPNSVALQYNPQT